MSNPKKIRSKREKSKVETRRMRHAEETPLHPYGLSKDEEGEVEVMHRNGWGIDEAAEELIRKRSE